MRISTENHKNPESPSVWRRAIIFGSNALVECASALWLVGRTLSPTILAVAVILLIAYVRHPTMGDIDKKLQHVNSLEDIIMLEQAKRTSSTGNTDLLLIGDSSCLMGIDPKQLSRQLDGIRVDSLCSIAWIGPVGYATMLRHYLEKHEAPTDLVIVLHLAQFNRKIEWDRQTEYIAHAFDKAYRLSKVTEALDYLEHALFDLVNFTSLKGRYKIYYGSAEQLRVAVQYDGSLIDPNTGLEPTLALHARQVNNTKTPCYLSSHALNQPFIDALKELAQAIALVGITKSHLLLSPIPDNAYCGNTNHDHEIAAQTIAAHLDLSPGQVLTTPVVLPNDLFSRSTHLNRWGKEQFTTLLANRLDGVLHKPGATNPQSTRVAK
ncbi:MAG: hypothetical protein HQL95_06845 [Magnetococcales bacterium]|nr:hypothetical protein [Magnetococcales bacterium]